MPCLVRGLSNDDVSLAGVTIVDNDSTDGSADGLTCPAPLNVIRMRSTVALRPRATRVRPGPDADFLLFLNPDTQLMPGSLERPAHYLQAPEHAKVGIIGIQLLDANGEVSRNTARTPTPLSLVGNSVGLDRPLPSVFPSHFVTEWAHDDTRTVDQVMGAFFLVRRSVFETLGGFDERFFVYYEDMDFAVRARKLGWNNVYLSTAQAFHRGQGTTDAATERRMFYFARSRVLYARKHFGALGALS